MRALTLMVMGVGLKEVLGVVKAPTVAEEQATASAKVMVMYFGVIMMLLL